MKRIFGIGFFLCIGLALAIVITTHTHAQSIGVFTATGQQAVTGTAAALAAQANNAGCIKALPGNTLTVYVGVVGVTTSTGYPLAASESLCAPTLNLNKIYVVASTTGSSVAWFVTNQPGQ